MTQFASASVSIVGRIFRYFRERPAPSEDLPAAPRPSRDERFLGTWPDTGGKSVVYILGGCLCSFYVEEVQPEPPEAGLVGAGPLTPLGPDQ